MSDVTSIVLFYKAREPEALLREVNRHFGNGGAQGLMDVHRYVGGTRAVKANIAIGAFEDFDLVAFIEHCWAVVDWERHDTVFAQIALHTEETSGFGIVEIYPSVKARPSVTP